MNVREGAQAIFTAAWSALWEAFRCRYEALLSNTQKPSTAVIPAKAGIHFDFRQERRWMTGIRR